ncbi:phage tail sheath subtilisin-like domain-containing protein [Photorhabdus temperata]|uniref:Phage tail sheath protein FI n=1 Tax=Photorhabdus temperata subsp. temperata Meg1 TaxID=1393735 RepID=A0A081S199_PHOTE|nr:phage tail sheath C-terminal domain-containing protein [Photorhabdus temperata]KER04702.1 phage tail sheath protein FI [Photorhabdus temperata subsp. temperata Meg1]MCT8345837.1 phage tail sheath subtilisin-like domain-containing protein [Photorhabdus temperata]
MPSDAYTTPGVYIEEDASLSLSISTSPTAIPVFIGKFFRKDGSQIEQGSCIKITSWLDFISQFSLSSSFIVSIQATEEKAEEKTEEKTEEKAEEKAEISAETVPKPLKNSQKNAKIGGGISVDEEVKKTYTYVADVKTISFSAFAVQHYFSNGGGVCYLLPLVAAATTDIPKVKAATAVKTAKAVKYELATLPDLIEKQQEITLLLCPETDETLAPSQKQEVYSGVNSLLKDKVGYFLIADSTDGEDKPTTQPDKTAVYYPYLETSFTYNQPAEADIVLSGYEDPSANNLETLKTASPEEYVKAKKAVDDKFKATKIILPPSAAVAGAYAATDASRGVWKAPANVALNNAKPVEVITDNDQSRMNKAGINAIRYFTGKGTLIWGARTLKDDDNWRYIPVRRLFNAAERDIKQAMRFAVFEPNSQPTWERVRSAIDNYLHQLWQQGALVGSSPQEAYFVQIGQYVTMSDDDIKQGKMIVKVGMAAVRPAEFIILKFSQKVAQ